MVKSGEDFYYIKDKFKYKLISQRAFDSWGLLAVAGTDETLQKFLLAGKLGFRDGTIVRDFSNGKIYFVANSKLRQVVSPEAMKYFVLDKPIIDVSPKELSVHKVGEDLD